MREGYTDEQVEQLAEKIAERLFEKAANSFYVEVGRSVVNKLLMVIGIGAMIVYGYFQTKPH